MGKLLVSLVTQCLSNSTKGDDDKSVKLNCDHHSCSSDDNTTIMIKDNFFICIKHLSDNYLLNDKNLIYRAEGNANLVLSLPETRQVLRFRKSFVNDSIADTSERVLNELKNFCEYTKFVTELIGGTYTCQPNFVYCDISDFKNFNQWLLNYRPADRLDKEIKYQYGTLYPDVAFLPNKILPPGFNTRTQVPPTTDSICSSSCSTRNTIKTDLTETISIDRTKKLPDTYCIEIKPKQGWQFFDDSNFETKLFKNLRYLKNFDKITKCRYCCMQYLKMCKGSIKEASTYCPIDLFSGISKRMHSAILGLIKSPQNNLRIFKNGELVYGDKIRIKYFNEIVREIFGSSKRNTICDDGDDGANEDVIDENDYKLNLFIKLLRKMLLKNYVNDSSSGKKGERYGKKCRRSSKDNCSNLNDNCALKTILHLQLLAKSSLSEIDFFDDTKNLDEYINGILLKWKNLVKESCNSSSSVVAGDPIRTFTENSISLNSKHVNIADDFMTNKLDKMEKYLVGATALDCSMMLAFQKVTNKDLVEIEQSDSAQHLVKLSHNLNFLTNITIMDLDPKSTTHYKKYLKQTELSYLSYYNYLYEN